MESQKIKTIDQGNNNYPSKLYSLSTKVNNFSHRGCRYDNVCISWFVTHRKKPVIPYELGIEGDANDSYNQGCLDELFTKDEADTFVDYLKIAHDSECEMEEYTLPIEGDDALPTGAIPVGGGNDILCICESKEYKLPFDVHGYFDVRHLTPIPQKTDFVIGYNVGKSNCGYCGSSIKIRKPLALCFRDSKVPIEHPLQAIDKSSPFVCDKCAQKYAHELYKLLNHFYNSGICEKFEEQPVVNK